MTITIQQAAEKVAERRPMTPYSQGYRAYFSGKYLNDNPYPSRDSAHREWTNGWYDAEADAGRGT